MTFSVIGTRSAADRHYHDHHGSGSASQAWKYPFVVSYVSGPVSARHCLDTVQLLVPRWARVK